MSEFSGQYLWLFLVFWAVAVLLIWNLHRYSGLMSRNKMAATVAAVSFLLFFAAWWTGRDNAPGSAADAPRIAVFLPPIVEPGQPPRVTLLSMEFAAAVAGQLTMDAIGQLRPYPIERLYASIALDSIGYPDYLRDRTQRLGYATCLVGTLSRKAEGATYELSVELIDGKRGDRLVSETAEISPDSTQAAAGRITAKIAEALGIAAPYGQPASRQSQELLKARLAYILQQDSLAAQYALNAIGRDSLQADAWALHAELIYRDPAFAHLDKDGRQIKLARVSHMLAEFSDADTTSSDRALAAARAYFWREKFNETALYALRAYRHGSCDSRVLNLLAKLHFSRYRPLGFDNEIALYRRALSCHPGDSESVLDLAATYMKLNRTPEAQRLLERHAQTQPENWAFLSALAQIYVSRGQAQNIFESYEKILSRFPEDVTALFNLGVYHHNLEDHETAERFFRRAIETGNHLNSRMYLARILLRDGRQDEAIEFLRERIRLKTGDEDEFAEAARAKLFELMYAMGKVDSLGNVVE